MAELKREELKVGNITDIAKETAGLVKKRFISQGLNLQSLFGRRT